MKKLELRQIIKEEVSKMLSEGPNMDMVNRSLDLLNKAADMAIRNPTGNMTELAKIIKQHTKLIRDNI